MLLFFVPHNVPFPPLWSKIPLLLSTFHFLLSLSFFPCSSSFVIIPFPFRFVKVTFPLPFVNLPFSQCPFFSPFVNIPLFSMSLFLFLLSMSLLLSFSQHPFSSSINNPFLPFVNVPSPLHFVNIPFPSMSLFLFPHHDSFSSSPTFHSPRLFQAPSNLVFNIPGTGSPTTHPLWAGSPCGGAAPSPGAHP